MKIVMDFRKFDGVIGGVEQGIIQVSKYLVEHGDQVVLVCKQSKETEVRQVFQDSEGLTLVPLPIRSHAISIDNARLDSGFFQELAEREKAQVIHFFYNWSFPFKKRVPSILTIHDVIPFTFREAMGFWRNRFVYRPSMRTACRLNDALATVSEFSKQDIAKKVGAPLDKIHVVPNGLRTPNKSTQATRTECVERYRLHDGFILNVGGIHERKNIGRLIEAFAILAAEKDYPGKLLITGSVSGAPYQLKMKKLCDAVVENHQLQDRLLFTGFIGESELDALLELAQVLIYPSLYEGFGIPILEAMLLGTPVVTSNVTALPEVAGNAAILVDPYDARQMADAVHRLLNDSSLREKLIAGGRVHAQAYTWERVGLKYLQLYESVVRNWRSRG